MSKQFIDEVNQDIKDEKLVIFWNKFKYFIIGGVAVIIIGTGGYSWYMASINKKLESQNVALDNALDDIQNDISALDTVIANSADGVQFIAVVNKAKALVDMQKYDEAIVTLNTYASQTNNPLQREYTQLSAVWVGIEAGKVASVPPELDTLITSQVFGDLAKLTKAEILLKSGDTAQATNILQSVVNGANTAQQYKSLATAILQGL